MLGSNGLFGTTTRKGLRGLTRLGVYCGAIAMLICFTGCIPPPPCTDDASCDDGVFCNGAETCGADGACADGTDPCTVDQFCNEPNDTCDACEDDADCDDGNACTADSCTDGACLNDATCDDNDACTENDTCGADGACAGTAIDCDDGVACTDDSCAGGACVNTDNCPAGQTCDELSGACVGVCDDAGDCDDLDDCTDDACVNGACQNTDVDCDDGVECTTDTCEGGNCVNADNCPEGQTCDTATGACTDIPLCEDDAACDDGIFCNGAETCVDGGCVSGDRPCNDANGEGCGAEGATEDCSEGDDAAVCTACVVDCFEFTLNQDNLSGTSGDDCFEADLAFNPASGTQIGTLQTGDSANGLAGADTLEAVLNGTGPTVVSTLAGIETIDITFFGDAANNGNVLTFNATNISGVDTIRSVGSTDDITVTGLQELTNFGFSGVNDANVDLQLDFAIASVTSGTADAISLSVGSTVGNATITVPAAAGQNGFETINVLSEGTAANTITGIVHAATSLATATFTGAQALTINTIPNSVRTINGSALTGALQLGTGTSAGAYTTFNTANLISLSGGSGNDLIIFNTTVDSNDFTTGTCDLGAGTDVVQLSFGADFLSASPFRNTEEARVNATATATVNFNGHTGLTTLTVEEDGTANALALQNVSATASVFPTLNFRGDNGTGANQTFDTVTYNAIGNTGSSDSLTVNVGNRGTAINSGTATTFSFAVGGAATTLNGFETVAVTCADGPCTFTGVGATTLVTLNVTGSSNVTLGQVDATGSTILTVNAANVTGNFSATVDEVATGANITLGGGNDIFTIGANSAGTSSFVTLGAGNDTFTGDTNTASADTISAGDGTDTVSGGQGIDTVTTGSGGDIVIYDQVAAAHAKNVTDFTSGAGGDILRFDISSLALASAGAEDSGAVAGLSVNDDIFILTGAGHATDAAAETALAADDDAAGQIVYIYFNTTDNSTHILYDTTAETDTTPAVLIGRLTNITTQAAHDLITTAANVDSQP